MDNPIKNNRIVNDMTFAIRLKSFLEEVKVNDAMSEEEQGYLIMVANKLIEYQVKTPCDIEEIEYLKRTNLVTGYDSKYITNEVLHTIIVTYRGNLPQRHPDRTSSTKLLNVISNWDDSYLDEYVSVAFSISNGKLLDFRGIGNETLELGKRLLNIIQNNNE